MKSFFDLRVRWIPVLIVSGLIVAAALLFFRYQLVPVGQFDIYRIDVLTGQYCNTNGTTGSWRGPACKPFVSPYLIVCGGATVYSRSQTCISPVPSPTITPTPADLVAVAKRGFDRLSASRPMSSWSFGAKTTMSKLQIPYVGFVQVLEASDGRLYVVYRYGCLDTEPDCNVLHFGILDGNKLQEVWLPHGRPAQGQREWGQLELLATSTPDVQVVRASLAPCARPISILRCNPGAARQYRVTSSNITAVTVTKDDSMWKSEDERLSDGETCDLDFSNKSATFVTATDAHGRTRPLFSKHDFLVATSYLLQPLETGAAYCTHFQDIDLLVVEHLGGNLTFVRSGKKLSLAAMAEPDAITPHHLLLFVQTPQEEYYGIGRYLDVTREITR